MMKSRNGFTISKRSAVLLFAGFLGSLIAVGLLVYYLADRPDPLASSSSKSPISPTSAPKKNAQVSTKNVRLPRAVIPRHYNIRLLPILERGNFTTRGHVSIDVECKEETDRIVLHSIGIDIDPKTVQVADRTKKEKLVVDKIEYDEELEFLIVRLCPKHKIKLVKGHNYTLSMNYIFNMTDDLKGFYLSTYKENGIEKYMAVSQMEPTDARRAFPCFDEPNMKATFTVTLGRHRDMAAISNMPKVNTTAIEGMSDYFWDHFAPSVPMSTYLVAFAIANFTRIEADVGNAKWQFNVYARPSAASQAEYAKQVGPKIQAFYEDFFQIPFPLPKQDMIAIPDFAAGAMENWGLITYRETALLYDKKRSSVFNKERVLEVIAHELAHQWFGNLVTMDWWSDLWLNEGFASYMEYLGAEHAEPELKILEQIVIKDVQDVMNLDALESSHPISVVVHHPKEINEIFDRISYGKGCSIIRMLHKFLGENTFQFGLTNYLTTRQYGNAVQDDLWNAFTNQAKINKVPLPVDVKTIMDTWTLKMGYPVINVKRDYETGIFTLHQERFLTRRSSIDSNDKTIYLWWVPITYTTDYKAIESTWLANNETSKILTPEMKIGKNQWTVFNIDQAGYFRVNYDDQNWGLLTNQLMTNHSVISTINRAQIMDDAFSLAEAGLLSYDVVMNLTLYLEHERDYLPWQATLNSLSYISSQMSRTSGYGLFKRHIKKIITQIYDEVGFISQPNESPLIAKLRGQVITWACKVGNQHCMKTSLEYYQRWMADPDNSDIVPVNLRYTILCNAIRAGGEAEWEFALNRYLTSNVASEQITLLSSMSCSQEPWILAKMLEMSLNSTSGIRRQDAYGVISQVSYNNLGRYMAFNFIRERWNDLTAFFTSFGSLARIIKAATSSFNTELELKEFNEFRDDQNLLYYAARATEQSVDKVKNNIEWMKKNYANVVSWLERYY